MQCRLASQLDPGFLRIASECLQKPVSTLHVFQDNPSLQSTPTHLTPPGKYTWPQRGNHACVSSFRPIFHVFREGLKLVEAPPLSTATAASADASIPATTCFSRRSLPVHLALNVRVLHLYLSIPPLFLHWLARVNYAIQNI